MSDLRQAVEALRRQLRFFRIKLDVDFHSMILGLSPPFIKLYRHLLCEYDSRVSLFLSSNNFLLHETEDHRFIELLYRICRDIFTMKPPLSLTQFLTNSFAGQKLKMATEIVKAVGELQKDLRRKAPKNRDVLSLICSPSAGPGGIRQRASQGACGDGAGGAVRGVGTTFPRSSQQNQLSSTQQTRLLIPPQQADAISSPTTDAESLCADDRLSPDHLHRGTLLAFPLQSKPKPGSSPSIVKDSLGCAKNEYLPGLLTTLNTLSNQLSQIVDRVAGIELRVCAIEKPIREAATNQAGPLVDKEKLKSKEKLTPHDSRRTDPHDITGLSPDSADRSDRVHSDEATPRPHLNILYPPIEEQLVYWRSRHPQDQLSLSETSASVEINDPLLSSINTSAAFSGRCQLQDVPDASISGRYSPRVSIHKEDCNAGSTNPITEAQAVLTVVNNPVFRQTFEQGAPIHQRGGPNSPLQPFTEPLHGKALPQSLATAAFHELSLPKSASTVLQSKSGAYIPSIMSHIESGDPVRGGNSKVFSKRPTAHFTNNDRSASIMECTNNSNNPLDVDQGLKQQVNRILNILTGTQDLLNSHRPLPTN
uniref:Centrosomal protein of 44 kDa n=1 Tax=Echinococcus granulosus TaxID=6210 RepID=A0A068WDV6_ECHGR|nr:centrosomal protein of 44 kDa [Echinococcus granulosus]